ncbi:LysM peptidoglycan-binding domain-containing protein [Neolewinella persica]|uniref:LysM peptidoglycan-binding domain-containing protein n=1 Tax=Neolewinella persica TaxID=70998 RepID=UPI0003A47BE4|nr:LysM peptidoglycan-binding domain-containing protein [Neolewinella persica]
MYRIIRLSSFLPALISLCLIAGPGAIFAQCPPANEAGLHVVQTNETLFSIAQQFNVSVDDLTTWNSLTQQELLKPCRELVVSSALVNPAMTSSGNAFAGLKQMGKWHTVRPGESVESLAELYGYTAARFREFNNLEGWRRIKPGAVLRATECACEPPARFNEPTPTVSPTLASSVVQVGSSYQAPEAIATDRAYMKVSESLMVDAINRMRANPRGFIPEVEAFVAAKNAEPWRKKPINARAVASLIKRLDETPPLSVLRAHPCLYRVAKNHGNYLHNTKQFRHDGPNGKYPWSRSLEACPTVKLGTTKGPNGNAVGNENLVMGLEPTEAVIYLLIDEGASDRAHRNTLLAPEWAYVSCFNYGTVNNVGHHFVQMFGR